MPLVWGCNSSLGGCTSPAHIPIHTPCTHTHTSSVHPCTHHKLPHSPHTHKFTHYTHLPLLTTHTLHPPHGRTDKHLWKQYLPLRSVITLHTYCAWYPPQSAPQVPSIDVPIRHLVLVSSKFTNLTLLTLNPWPKGRTIPVLVPVPAPFGAARSPPVEWADKRKINCLGKADPEFPPRRGHQH